MKKKLIVIAAIIVVFGAFCLTDWLISLSYTMQVISVSPQPAYADGETPVNIKIKLTRGGKPVAGHVLYTLPKKGGLKAARVLTKEDGTADFVYFPYLASGYIKAGKVGFQTRDESNSIFVSFPARLDFDISLQAPQDLGDGSGHTVDEIFGE